MNEVLSIAAMIGGRDMPERSLYEDKLDWVMSVVDVMKKIDYEKQEIYEREEFSIRLSSVIRSFGKMIHREERSELIVEIESILENITASLAWLTRNEKIGKQILHYQIPFLVWNLKYVMQQWLAGNRVDYLQNLKKSFFNKYTDWLTQRKLIIIYHLDEDFANIVQNIAHINVIIKAVDKTELLTIADSPSTAVWMEKISNNKRLQIFHPMSMCFIPPFICNGEYVLDIPKGSVCSDSIAKMVPYMLQEGHEIYKDKQGIKLIKTMEEIVPYHRG